MSYSQPARMSERMRRSLDTLFLLFGLAFTIYLIRYYVTGAGGATTLAVLLVPVAYVLFVLDALRKDALYPKLPLAANYVLASAMSVEITTGVFSQLPQIALTLIGSFILVLSVHVTVRLQDAQGWSWRPLLEPSRRFVSTFSSMVSDLTLLLATLSIMTGALVITGVPTKLGALLMDAAGVNLAVMALVAFLFSALLGTGLPPAPTYIITALVIVPPMIRAGIDPWVVHFFAFFCAVWGELTPPTSVVAAVTARIAETSFVHTLGHALVMCVSLFTLMIGVFTHPQLVLEPGLAQLAAFGMILTATIGVCFSIHARFFDTRFADMSMRLALVGTSLAVLLIPDPELSATLCVPVLLVVAYWVLMRRSHWVKPYQRASA